MNFLPPSKTHTLKAEDFMLLLEQRGLVIGPKDVFEAGMVKGVPFEQYRKRILARPQASFLEISKARLWGSITKSAVEAIVKKHIDPSDLIHIRNTLYVPRALIRSVAVSRGMVLE